MGKGSVAGPQQKARTATVMCWCLALCSLQGPLSRSQRNHSHNKKNPKRETYMNHPGKGKLTRSPENKHWEYGVKIGGWKGRGRGGRERGGERERMGR